MKVEKKQRTIDQNSAMHVYFKLVSDALNDAGYSIQEVLKEEMEIDWTPELVKKILWKKAQEAHLEKDSTTKLTSDEVTKVYEHVNRFTSKFGIGIPFPEDETKSEI